MAQPFSENIIFFDTEFSSLDPNRGELLSIGAIKFSGEEFYCEIDFKGEADDWQKKNILPFLKKRKYSKEEVVRRLYQFTGSDKPFMLSYVNQYDAVYLYQMLGALEKEDRPFFWIPIDFASILFGLGLDPELLHYEDGFLYDLLGINTDEYIKHNALDDARLLRDVYLELIQDGNVKKIRKELSN